MRATNNFLSGAAFFITSFYIIHTSITYLLLMYHLLHNVLTQEFHYYLYFSGNNWGACDDGTAGMGCGPQETFRSCSGKYISVLAKSLEKFLMHSLTNAQ